MAQNKFFLIAGPCVIEDEKTAFLIAETVLNICKKLDIDYIFKGSYRKANRTKQNSFTGIGDQAALEILQAVGKKFGIATITDVHESHEVALAARYVSHLQIPAFLCRQTDLLKAAGESGCTVNIKKGQFLSPEAMLFPIEKVQATGNPNIWITERGTTFGYNDLIVDATSIARMKAHGVPVVMDCTHATQKPNRTEGVTGGDPQLIETIALSAVATGADGLFLEVHPNPAIAASDAATMLQLDKLEAVLQKVMKVRNALNS
ncbi:MAG TPA: 3-deoxy-8-phosphooctulonate synthase [Bacteroidales bacterium]|nr:3-deoxy-8-phosphooctulonate synthase [Bacteroidales bacterium]